MKKKSVLMLCLISLSAVVLVFVLILIRQKNPDNILLNTQNKIESIAPSKTYKDYQDPSGFTLSYPDNLSITNNDTEDNSTYADIQLFAKGVNGSLSLKITDSKFTSIDEWLKLNKEASRETPKEVKLGSLKAFEIITQDRLLLGALDNGVFFDIEVPLIEKEFWLKVYDKVLSSFSFALPQAEPQTNDSSDSVIFEGEETIE